LSVLAGTLGPSRAGLRREAQREGALPLLEPVERLAGGPVVAVPLQIPAGRFGAERSAGVGDDAAFPVLLDPLDGLPAGRLTLDGGRRLAELAQPCGPLKLDRSARRPRSRQASYVPSGTSPGRNGPFGAVRLTVSDENDTFSAWLMTSRRGMRGC
jgi:hypothetical protein